MKFHTIADSANRLLMRAACLAVLLGIAATSTAQATYLVGTGGAPNVPALALGTTINFDSVTPANYSSLAQGNVKFIGLDGPFSISAADINQFSTSGVNSLQTGNIQPPFYPSQWEFVFTIPVAAFAFNYGASDNTWQINAYDSSNVLLETDYTTPTGGSNAGDYVGIAAVGIAKVVLIDQLDNYPTGDQVFIDDFNYTYELVPEPSSFVLCLTALGAGAAWAWRRRSRQ